MAGRLKTIVDYVKAKSYFKNLAIVQLNLELNHNEKVKINTDEFRNYTPDDPELEERLIRAAKKVLGVEHLDISY